MLKNPGKADLDKDGTLTSYEKKRGKAIEDSMAGKDERSKFMGGGIAYAGGGRAMKKKGKI